MCETVGFYFSTYLIAGDPLSSSKILNDLSRSSCARIRARVAENPKTPMSTLLGLVNDQASEVRISLTYNSNLLPFIAHELAWDQDPDVRYALAENAHAPVEALRLLLTDENPYVSSRAAKTLERGQRDSLANSQSNSQRDSQKDSTQETNVMAEAA